MEIHIPSGGSFLDTLFKTNEIYGGDADNVIPDADEKKLRDTLAAFERGDCEYIILQDDNRFLQAAGDIKSGYALEYNDGSDSFQFRATNRNISNDDLTSAFVSYLNGDASWRGKFTWEKFSF